MKFKTQLYDEIAVKRAMTRLSYEIIERSPVLTNVVLIGIKTRGVPLAKIIKCNKKKLKAFRFSQAKVSSACVPNEERNA